MEPLKIFVSYSHDSDEHKEWVYKLSCDLMRNAGVEVLLDQWDLELGSNLPRFMQDGLSSADRVIVVCTDSYNEKSNLAKGGAGYEGSILTAELFRQQDSNKYIPLIRSVSGELKVPRCLDGRVYTDFSKDEDYQRRFLELKHELYGVPLKPKPPRGRNPFEVDSRPKMNLETDEYFGMVFGQSFPGIRGTETFTDPEVATARLSHFLKGPFEFQDGTPFWWWRDGNLHIYRFIQTGPSSVLMNNDELNIREISVVHSNADYRKFIYVECSPSTETGVNSVDYEWHKDTFGYVSEEFAIYDGGYINSTAADDGAIVIDGKPVPLSGEVKRRCRYLTPYNFVIAANHSCINNLDFDKQLVDILGGMLSGQYVLKDLISAVGQLPKPDRHHR